MGKKRTTQYNAQAAADHQSHFIVAMNVVNDPQDRLQFEDMHARCEQNLKPNPKRQYNADAGYHSLKQLAYIKEHNVDAVIAETDTKYRLTQSQAKDIQSLLNDGNKINRSDFIYKEEGDYYLCPAGRELHYRHLDSRQKRVYYSQNCSNCLLFNLCISKDNKSGLRQTKRATDEYLAERMFKKSHSEEGKERLKERSKSIEPVFGNIKENMGFRRFTLHGLNQVKGEFAMMCIAHNIRILYKYLSLKDFSLPFLSLLKSNIAKMKLIWSNIFKPMRDIISY